MLPTSCPRSILRSWAVLCSHGLIFRQALCAPDVCFGVQKQTSWLRPRMSASDPMRTWL